MTVPFIAVLAVLQLMYGLWWFFQRTDRRMYPVRPEAFLIGLCSLCVSVACVSAAEWMLYMAIAGKSMYLFLALHAAATSYCYHQLTESAVQKLQ